MPGTRQTVRRVLVVLFVIALAACGSSTDADDTATTTTTTVTEEASESTTAAVAEAPPRRAGIGVAPSDLGDVLIDGDGSTLYLLVSDQRGNSTCNATCQNAWVPLPPDLVGDLPDLLDPADFDEAIGPDGHTPQATFKGWPLYTYSLEEPGQMTGHGLFDAFFAVGLHGEAVGITE